MSLFIVSVCFCAPGKSWRQGTSRDVASMTKATHIW